MMREEIQINHNARCAIPKCVWIIFNLKREPAPSLGDVARHAGIHKSSIERHAQNFGISIARIWPWAHMYFENFHGSAQYMKQADYFEFINCFHFQKPNHGHLHGNTEDEHLIIAWNKGKREVAGNDQHGQDGYSKKTGHGFLVSKPENEGGEMDEFIQSGSVRNKDGHIMEDAKHAQVCQKFILENQFKYADDKRPFDSAW